MQNMNYKSVFEDLIDPTEIGNYRLYQEVMDKHEINYNKKVIFEGILKMYNKKTGKMVSKHFRLMDKKLLVYKKQPSKTSIPNNYYNLLQFYRIYFSEYKQKEEQTFSFTLSKYGKFHEFFSHKKAEIITWIDHLKYYCVSTDFSSHFEIITNIGKGHFAKVYKVKRKSSGEYFAAKVFKKDKAFDEEKHFVRKEVLVLKKLPKSDKIVRLYEVFEDAAELVLIFELISGGDLYSKIKHKHKYSEQEVAIIFFQILKGIEFLHGNGVLHRDIKLENILLNDKSENTEIKIADFSLAEIGVENKYYSKCGTPGFMAPEIFGDEGYDKRIDIFSAGIVLYILLSGNPPFKGKDGNEILENNKSCIIKYKKQSWENISRTGRKLVSSLVCRNPDQRITIMQALAHDFLVQYNRSQDYIKINNKNQFENPFIILERSKESLKSGPDNSSKGQSSGKSREEIMRSREEILRKNSSISPQSKKDKKENNINQQLFIEQDYMRTFNSFFLSSCNQSKDFSLTSELNSGTIHSHFTGSDHKKSFSGQKNKDSSISYHSSYQLSLNTLKGTFKGANSNTRTLKSKTEDEKDHYSSITSQNKYYEIFFDENPVLNLLNNIKVFQRKPHPSKTH